MNIHVIKEIEFCVNILVSLVGSTQWIYSQALKYIHSCVDLGVVWWSVYRCQCYGHADKCDTSSQPYRCLCSLESFTQGRHVSSLFDAWKSKKKRGKGMERVGKMVTINSLNLILVYPMGMNRNELIWAWNVNYFRKFLVGKNPSKRWKYHFKK